jgi:hypothetical protein
MTQNLENRLGEKPQKGISRRGFLANLALAGAGITMAYVGSNQSTSNQAQAEEYTFERAYNSISAKKGFTELADLTEEQKSKGKKAWDKLSPSLRKTATYWADNIEDDEKCFEFTEKEYTFERFVESLGKERTKGLDLGRLRKDWNESYSTPMKALLCETYEGGLNQLTDAGLLKDLNKLDVKTLKGKWDKEKAWTFGTNPNGQMPIEDKIFIYIMENLGPNFPRLDRPLVSIF